MFIPIHEISLLGLVSFAPCMAYYFLTEDMFHGGNDAILENL